MLWSSTRFDCIQADVMYLTGRAKTSGMPSYLQGAVCEHPTPLVLRIDLTSAFGRLAIVYASTPVLDHSPSVISSHTVCRSCRSRRSRAVCTWHSYLLPPGPREKHIVCRSRRPHCSLANVLIPLQYLQVHGPVPISSRPSILNPGTISTSSYS